jgi:putative addiction module killer protein
MREAVPRKVETYVTREGKDEFHGWLDGLADMRARVLIDKTIAKIRLGNFGDHKSVGEGVQETRLNYGPGYRIYFAEHGSILVILLCGGTKKRQDRDIAQAKRYWTDWKARTLK